MSQENNLEDNEILEQNENDNIVNTITSNISKDSKETKEKKEGRYDFNQAVKNHFEKKLNDPKFRSEIIKNVFGDLIPEDEEDPLSFISQKLELSKSSKAEANEAIVKFNKLSKESERLKKELDERVNENWNIKKKTFNDKVMTSIEKVARSKQYRDDAIDLVINSIKYQIDDKVFETDYNNLMSIKDFNQLKGILTFKWEDREFQTIDSILEHIAETKQFVLKSFGDGAGATYGKGKSGNEITKDISMTDAITIAIRNEKLKTKK